jgi:hypothetical protein
MAVLDGQAGLVSQRIAQNLRAEFRRNWPGASHLELNELINQAIEGATEWGAVVELLLPRLPDNRESWNEPPAGFNPP